MASVKPLVKPGDTNVVTNNMPVTVPVYEILDRRRRDHPIFTQTTITTTYRNATATIVPEPSSPGLHFWDTHFICPACNGSVPILIRQVTVLPVKRAQLGFGKDMHNPFRLLLAIILSQATAKFVTISMISFCATPIVYLYTDIGRTPGALPFLEAWGISTLISWGAYILYAAFRVAISGQILVPVLNRVSYGYGSADCFNVIIYARIKNEGRSVYHSSDVANANDTYGSGILYPRFKLDKNAWVAIRH